MLRVWSVAGQELAAAPAEDLGGVLGVKRHLCAQHGYPVPWGPNGSFRTSGDRFGVLVTRECCLFWGGHCGGSPLFVIPNEP